MHPVDRILGCRIFDAVAGFAVVLHDLAPTDAAFDVNLVEDDIAVSCDAEQVFSNEMEDGVGFKERGEEKQEVGERVGAYSPDYNVARKCVDRSFASLRMTHRFGLDWLCLACDPVAVFGVGIAPVGLGRRVFDVSAGGFVVASAVLFTGGTVVFVYIRGEAMLASALGTGPAAGGACVLEKVVTVVHAILPPLCTGAAAAGQYRFVSAVPG